MYAPAKQAKSNQRNVSQEPRRQGVQLTDNRPASVFQRKLTAVRQNSSAPHGVIQRDILVGDTWKKPYNDTLVETVYNWVRPSLRHWLDDKEIKKKHIAAPQGEALENRIRALLRKYSDKKSFENDTDLARQTLQDLKLELLNMPGLVGINHHDGQFSQTDDLSKNKTLRIYRTMPLKDWTKFNETKDFGDILFGHGGSLGQALHYYSKSKAEGKDDALVEFAFTGKSQDLMDHTNVEKGGEGGGPAGNKLTGKSEKNDLMAKDANIFSVNLKKSKDRIRALNPKVTLIEKAS